MKACGPPDARGVGRAFAIVVCVSSRKPRRGWRTHLLRNRFRRFGGMVIRDETDAPKCAWAAFGGRCWINRANGCRSAFKP